MQIAKPVPFGSDRFAQANTIVSDAHRDAIRAGVKEDIDARSLRMLDGVVQCFTVDQLNVPFSGGCDPLVDP